MKFPLPDEAEYIYAIGIAAVFVAALGENSVVRVARDLQAAEKKLRVVWPDLSITDAWWVKERSVALTIARTARILLPKDSFGRLLASTERTRNKVLSVAASQGVKLTEHATVMKRVGPAVGRVNDALRLANGRGELAWFNRAYRLYRLQKAERGGPILSYQKARVRLRCAMLRRLVLVHRLEYGPEMLEEVFAGD